MKLFFYSFCRYYLVTIFYVFIVATYTNIYNFEFVGEVMGGHTVGTWICIAMPHVAIVLGRFNSLLQAFVAVLTFIGYFFMILVGFLIYEQIKFISHGQTKYEHKKDIKSYDQGWRKNFTELLGNRWFLVFLSPWVESKVGNGINFTKVE